MGNINLHRVDAAGSLVEKELLEPQTVPRDGEAHITNLGVTAEEPARDTRVTLLARKLATDSWTPIDEFQLPDPGERRESRALPDAIRLDLGWQFRATFIQGTIGRVTLTVGGRTQAEGIADL